MRNLKRVIYTSSYDHCNYLNDMIRLVHEKSRKARKAVQKWMRSNPVAPSISLREKIVLFFEVQRGMARKIQDWLLEGEKDALLFSAKQRYTRGQEPKLAWRKKNRQDGVFSYIRTEASLLRRRWIREGASLGNGEINQALLNRKGGSASY